MTEQEDLRLTNTITGNKEVFEPLNPNEVYLYVCGLTVSDDPHLGHARTWISFDVLHRYVEFLGYDVVHVENVTDIDDKIINKAEEMGIDPVEVANRYSQQVFQDMKDMNLRRVEIRPHVTEHIDDIVEMTQQLLDNGYAYESDDGVYFSVEEFSEYGKLSGQKLDGLEQQGEETEHKRDPRDFALWKNTDSDPRWGSPWGEGRPGWHIECSAMSTRHLGNTIDIHGGGRDLVFPHHENEIAQSEAATGDEFTRYWLHVGPLRVEGDKMSTSLENFWTVHDALREYTHNEVRMFLISTQYTNPQSFTDDALDEARRRWRGIQSGYQRAVEAMDSGAALSKKRDGELRETVRSAEQGFIESMDDDLNTPAALAELEKMVAAVNSHVESNDSYDYQGLFRAWLSLGVLLGDVLGFEVDRISDMGITDDLVEYLLDLRDEFRGREKYDLADDIRDSLGDLGVEVQDSDDGAKYRFTGS